MTVILVILAGEISPKPALTMKKFTLLLFIASVSVSAQMNCTNAYASASYALAHAKRALSADNFDHQRYYAERALVAFEKTEQLAAECGCEESHSPIYKGQENLDKAIDPKDWEMGRYYTKKAVANAHDVLTALDICSSGKTSEMIAEVAEDSADSDASVKDPEELQAQQTLKRVTELTFFEFEKSVKEIASLLGCGKAIDLLGNKTFKSEEALESESLETTRQYYLQQSIALQKKALDALSGCANAGAQDTSMESKP